MFKTAKDCQKLSQFKGFKELLIKESFNRSIVKENDTSDYKTNQEILGN